MCRSEENNVTQFRRDFETVEEARKRMAREDQAEPLTVETDIGQVLDEPAAPLVIKPGTQHARAAFRAGREDDYSDRMRSRYGGEW
jgi:hypothetical protein